MSDNEDDMHSEEEEESAEPEAAEDAEDEPKSPTRREMPPPDEGPSEAQLAMQRRREQAGQHYEGLDEYAAELLEANRAERDVMAQEIDELRARSERRKKEREEEERNLNKMRQEEDHRRKAEEDERKQKKEHEETERREQRAAKMAEFDKWKNPQSPNFVITKKDKSEGGGDEEEEEHERPAKSKEQLDSEKKAILDQRIQPLNINGFDTAKLSEKAKELRTIIYRLESDKYDLEKRFRQQQYNMMELAERARQMNKVGRGGLKRVAMTDDDVDKMQERFAGCPSKILMYSKFERQKDGRKFDSRRDLYVGPMYGYPADKITPTRILRWSEDGLPEYADTEDFEHPEKHAEEEAAEQEPEPEPEAAPQEEEVAE